MVTLAAFLASCFAEKPGSADSVAESSDSGVAGDSGGDDSGGGASGWDDSGSPDTSDGDSGWVPLAHDADIQPIWDENCGPCHLDARQSGELTLVDAYDQLVGVPSSELPSMDRVTPGDLDTSYLWLKVVGTHRDAGGTGVQMPKNDTMREQDIARIGLWIQEGAVR